jgi:ribonuclease D
MNAAMDTATLQRRVGSEEINAMPLCRYGGTVRLVRSLDDWKGVLPGILAERVLGFDTETRPTFKKGKANDPALMQIATEHFVCLIQLSGFPFGTHIAAILANPDQIKAGVGIRDDMRELAHLHAFEPAGLVDLGVAARAHKISTQGLRALAANLVNRRISKGSQCSNWSLPELSKNQILYAATDAWISRLIFLRMHELGLVPPVPALTCAQTSVFDALRATELMS